MEKNPSKRKRVHISYILIKFTPPMVTSLEIFESLHYNVVHQFFQGCDR